MSKSDKVDLTCMAIREMLMSYYKGDSGARFVKNSYLSWNPIATPGRRYNYRQARQQINDPRALVFGDKCMGIVGRNPDTFKFCVDTFRGNAIIQEIQSSIEEVFSRYLKGVKLTYDGKGEPISTKDAKEWCEKAKYIDHFDQPEDPMHEILEQYVTAQSQRIINDFSGGYTLRAPTVHFTTAYDTIMSMQEESDD